MVGSCRRPTSLTDFCGAVLHDLPTIIPTGVKSKLDAVSGVELYSVKATQAPVRSSRTRITISLTNLMH